MPSCIPQLIGNAVGIDAPLRLAHHNLHLFLSCPTARGIGKCGRDGSRYHVLLKTRPRNCECLVWRTLVFSLEMESLDDSKWKDVASTVPPTSAYASFSSCPVRLIAGDVRDNTKFSSNNRGTPCKMSDQQMNRSFSRTRCSWSTVTSFSFFWK